MGTGRAMDTAYVERANGRWEAWTYSDGVRVMIARHHGDKRDVTRDLRAEGFEIVWVQS